MSEASPTMPSPTPSETATTLGLSQGDIVKVVLGLAAGALLAVFGFWLNRSSPHLATVIPPPVQFQGEKSKFGVITFNVTNDGSKEATNVVCIFNSQGAKQIDIQAVPTILNPLISIKDQTVTIKVASLNQGERLTVVAHLTDVIPEKPEVNVRGDGVNGEEKPLQQPAWKQWITYSYMLMLLLLQIPYVIWMDRLADAAARKRLFVSFIVTITLLFFLTQILHSV